MNSDKRDSPLNRIMAGSQEVPVSLGFVGIFSRVVSVTPQTGPGVRVKLEGPKGETISFDLVADSPRVLMAGLQAQLGQAGKNR